MKPNGKRWAGGLGAVVLAAVLLALPAAGAQDKGGPEDVKKIPAKVMKALMKKFPKAKITKWTKEKEDGKVFYDIEFQQENKDFEADIQENGSIHNWEKEIPEKSLPAAVKKTLQRKYPKAEVKEVMQVTAVFEGKDLLVGYEIFLSTADKKSVEITVGSDGKVIEESGASE